MDELFEALADGRRTWLLVQVLRYPDGLTQEELRRALAKHDDAPVNPGTMTRLLGPLFAAKLVRRTRPRGPITAVHAAATRQALIVAARLAQALATNTQMDAGREARDTEDFIRELNQPSEVDAETAPQGD
jgi:hypothetical protein